MRAVSSGYGGDSGTTDSPDSVDLSPVTTEATPEVPLAVAEEVTTKRSSKTKSALVSVLTALGIGATPLLSL